jgi:hypothetical protein
MSLGAGLRVVVVVVGRMPIFPFAQPPKLKRERKETRNDQNGAAYKLRKGYKGSHSSRL